MASEILSDEGHKVMAAENAAQARACYERFDRAGRFLVQLVKSSTKPANDETLAPLKSHGIAGLRNGGDWNRVEASRMAILASLHPLNHRVSRA